MIELVASSLLEVKESPIEGLGVFAKEDISAETVIHIAPVLFFPIADLEKFNDTELSGYSFVWYEEDDPEESWYVLCLGVGSLFNHSFDPNVYYEHWSQGEVDDATGHTFAFDALRFITAKDVKAGDELFHSYAETPEDLWFDVA